MNVAHAMKLVKIVLDQEMDNVPNAWSVSIYRNTIVESVLATVLLDLSPMLRLMHACQIMLNFALTSRTMTPT